MADCLVPLFCLSRPHTLLPREQLGISDECRARVLSTDVTKFDIFEEARLEVLGILKVGIYVRRAGGRRRGRWDAPIFVASNIALFFCPLELPVSLSGRYHALVETMVQLAFAPMWVCVCERVDGFRHEHSIHSVLH